MVVALGGYLKDYFFFFKKASFSYATLIDIYTSVLPHLLHVKFVLLLAELIQHTQLILYFYLGQVLDLKFQSFKKK